MIRRITYTQEEEQRDDENAVHVPEARITQSNLYHNVDLHQHVDGQTEFAEGPVVRHVSPMGSY